MGGSTDGWVDGWIDGGGTLGGWVSGHQVGGQALAAQAAHSYADLRQRKEKPAGPALDLPALLSRRCPGGACGAEGCGAGEMAGPRKLCT